MLRLPANFVLVMYVATAIANAGQKRRYVPELNHQQAGILWATPHSAV
jgi:hypothetical protein